MDTLTVSATTNMNRKLASSLRAQFMPLIGSKESGLHVRGQENPNTAGQLNVEHGLRQGTLKP